MGSGDSWKEGGREERGTRGTRGMRWGILVVGIKRDGGRGQNRMCYSGTVDAYLYVCVCVYMYIHRYIHTYKGI